jgi:hypothetical protein
MKFFLKIFAVTLIIINILFYLFTIKEGQEVLGKKETWFGNVVQSFEYYITWVLPYWWFIILIAGIVISFIALGVKKLL